MDSIITGKLYAGNKYMLFNAFIEFSHATRQCELSLPADPFEQAFRLFPQRFRKLLHNRPVRMTLLKSEWGKMRILKLEAAYKGKTI